MAWSCLWSNVYTDRNFLQKTPLLGFESSSLHFMIRDRSNDNNKAFVFNSANTFFMLAFTRTDINGSPLQKDNVTNMGRSVCLPMCLCMCVCMCVSVCLSICLSVCVCQSVCLFVCLSHLITLWECVLHYISKQHHNMSHGGQLLVTFILSFQKCLGHRFAFVMFIQWKTGRLITLIGL